MRIVIAGVGYTGRRLMRALPESQGINRSRVPEFAADRLLLRDLDDAPQQAIPLLSDCALLYTIPPAAKGATDTRLATFLDALPSAPARIVYLSSTGVYGDRHGELTAEDVQPAPAVPRTVRRWNAEKAIFKYCADSGCLPLVLRVPGIYGPQRLNIERLESRQAFIGEAQANPGNRIHVDDLLSCCLAALMKNVPPGVYNVGDGDHTSSIGMAGMIAKLAGLPAPLAISAEKADAAFSEKRKSYLQESRRIDTRKMREVLGVVPQYASLLDGVRASLIEDGYLTRGA